jgi:hypothetical protein
MNDPFEEIRRGVELLYAQEPGRAEDVRNWSKTLIGTSDDCPVSLISEPTSDVARLVRELCQWFGGAAATEKAFGDALDLGAREALVPKVLRLRNLAPGVAGAIDAAIEMGWAGAADKARVMSTIEQIIECARPLAPKVQFVLEGLLVELMRTAGYGKSSPQLVSKARAASLLTDAARESGFQFKEDAVTKRFTTAEHEIRIENNDLLQRILISLRA